jgi:hypothetical protein
LGGDLRGLRALLQEEAPRRTLLVSRADRPRRTEEGIKITPWPEFCAQLWAGDLIA